MAPFVAYGRRNIPVSNTDLFMSPPKSRVKSRVKTSGQVDVLEVADELASLTLVSDTTLAVEVPIKQERRPLSRISPNQRAKPDRHGENELEKNISKQKASISKTETILSSNEISDETSRDDYALTSLERDVYYRHTADLLGLSLRKEIIDFEEWSSELSSFFKITKIAEASYGEVYRLSLLESHSTFSTTDESVLKIIPLKPPPALRQAKTSKTAKERFDMMSEPADVTNEVRLLQNMTSIPGFTNFRDISVIKGRPGQAFVKAWSAWNAERKSEGRDVSTYPNPARKTSYGDDQLWAVLEMQDAGTDLEREPVDSIWSLWDIFWNVTLTLGKGEESAEFEHRDLHMGNVCISRHDRAGSKLDAEIDTTRKLGFTTIETTIIDYTLSRARCSRQAQIKNGAREEIVYLDLDRDNCLFEGDGALEYQYDIYRYMRGLHYFDNAYANVEERWPETQSSTRTWKTYRPKSNLIWLHLILHSMSEQIKWPSAEARQKCNDRQSRRAHELEEALKQVQVLLEPHRLARADALKSAGDLVALALERKWLDTADVIGHDDREHS